MGKSRGSPGNFLPEPQPGFGAHGGGAGSLRGSVWKPTTAGLMPLDEAAERSLFVHLSSGWGFP